MAKFTRIAHSPGPKGLPRRGHNTAGRYYRSLMYTTPQRTLSVHKKPHTTGGRQEKSRAALGRGISEGVRLNDNHIVLPRRARAHTPFGVFLSSPNGRFIYGGCVL
jgi:hypothetical protein